MGGYEAYDKYMAHFRFCETTANGCRPATHENGMVCTPCPEGARLWTSHQRATRPAANLSETVVDEYAHIGEWGDC
jgi:hypothetical protein